MMLSVLPYTRLIAALLFTGLAVTTVWPTRPARTDLEAAKRR